MVKCMVLKKQFEGYNIRCKKCRIGYPKGNYGNKGRRLRMCPDCMLETVKQYECELFHEYH